jgi:hypothetical protein
VKTLSQTNKDVMIPVETVQELREGEKGDRWRE